MQRHMINYLIMNETIIKQKWLMFEILVTEPFLNNLQALRTKTLFSHFSTKTYVVGTQKNRLHETVLLSTQNIR